MSTWHDLAIDCAACRHRFTVKVASGLHISRLPAVREQIVRGELHRFECPACAQRIEVQRPVVYTDFERAHWIEVWPPAEIARWRELARACAASFARVLEQGAPMLRDRAADFRVRIVFGYDELREKIVIWDTGLDDVAIECLKLLALRRDVSILGPADRLLLTEIDGERYVFERRRGDKPIAQMWSTISTGELGQLRDDFTCALDPIDDPFVSFERWIKAS